MLSNILFQLLYHKSIRDKFINGVDIGWSDKDQKDLALIDKSELLEMSQRIIKNLLYSVSGHGGELYASFPNILRLIEPKKPIEIIEEFLESKEFSSYHLIPFDGAGLCLQEAFYNFLKDHSSYKNNYLFHEYLIHEFLSSSIRLLSVNKNPSFRFASNMIIFLPHLIYGIHKYSQAFMGELKIKNLKASFLYAFNRNQIIVGPIPTFYGEIISANPDAKELKRICDKNGISEEIGTEAYNKLCKLALVTKLAA